MGETKPKRRLFRYSLRTLLLAMTVLCIWLAVQVNSARRQKEAVEAILKAGGHVWFDYQIASAKSVSATGFAIDPNLRPKSSAWLRSIFGEDFFRSAVAVEFIGAKAADVQSILPQLARLTELKSLNLTVNQTDSRIPWPTGDEELAVLGQLTKLETVVFAGIEAHLAYLSHSDQLRELSLQNTSLSRASMQEIGQLKNLQKLRLNYCAPFDNAGVEQFTHLDKLENVFISYTPIYDAGLSQFKAMPNIKVIFLLGTDVSDQAVHKLQGCLPNARIISRRLQ